MPSYAHLCWELTNIIFKPFCMNNFAKIYFAKFRLKVLRNFAKFREIIVTKFREISLNIFQFRINFVFREIEKKTFVSTLVLACLSKDRTRWIF
jgi:hypothetical protein